VSAGSLNASSLSLEQLVALNDEMAALIRAGVPLEQGLESVGSEMPGRIGDIAVEIGQRMRDGESLPQILASDSHQFPPVWRAIVEAGLRSGRLSSALESLSTTARRVGEFRRWVAVAWVYPVVVMIVAYVFFIFLVTWITPRTYEAIRSLTPEHATMAGFLFRIGQSAAWWGPLIPLFVAAVAVAQWHRSGRAMWLERQHAWRAGGSCRDGMPTARRVLQVSRVATFAEILTMLLDHLVPMPEAVALAADASGDPNLRDGARQLGQLVAEGHSFTSRDQLPPAFPPMIGWLLVSGTQRSQLTHALRMSAENYRRRAASAAAWNAAYLPLVLTALVGGFVTLLQALAVFAPVLRLLYELG
jgi:general secretion pathway protein F